MGAVDEDNLELCWHSQGDIKTLIIGNTLDLVFSTNTATSNLKCLNLAVSDHLSVHILHMHLGPFKGSRSCCQ